MTGETGGYAVPTSAAIFTARTAMGATDLLYPEVKSQ